MSLNTLINEAVPFGELELELMNEPASKWKQRFTGRSYNACNMLMIALCRHATDKEIQQTFYRRKRDVLVRNLLSGKVVNFCSEYRQVIAWKKKLNRLEPKLFEKEGSYEKTIHAGENYWLIHYQSKKSINKNKKRSTIIGFSGNAGQLMAPPACILAGLDESEQDLIIVRRCYKHIYFHDNEFILKKIIDHLFLIFEESLYDATTLGTSSGGLAALCFGQMLELRCTVLIAPSANQKALSILRPDITSSIKNNNEHSSGTKDSTFSPKRLIKLCAAERNPNDVKNVLAIKSYLGNNLPNNATINSYFFKNCSSHGYLPELANNGIPLSKSLIPLITTSEETLPEHTLMVKP